MVGFEKVANLSFVFMASLVASRLMVHWLNRAHQKHRNIFVVNYLVSFFFPRERRRGSANRWGNHIGAPIMLEVVLMGFCMVNIIYVLLVG